MSGETKYFICRNNACKGGNIGGAVINYQETEDNVYQCPFCGQTYIILKDGTVVAFFDEKVFDSFSAYNDFQDQFYSKELFINKLILKGINDNEHFLSTIAFRKCWFGEVHIEDLDIHTPSYPIAFDDCKIDRFYIEGESKILHKNRYDYWSPYHFFGINLIRTEIREVFEITGLHSSMCIVDSGIACTMDIKNSVVDDLVLVNNDPGFMIKADKHSAIIRNKAVTDGKAPIKDFMEGSGIAEVKRKKIDKLVIDPEATGIIVVSDAEIKNLVFPEDAVVAGRLIFNNCLIRNLQNHSRTFNRAVVFKACKFMTDTGFSRSDFKGDLVFEACIFEEKFYLDELKTQKDLHLSYSYFKKDVEISQVSAGGYFITHFSGFQGQLHLERLEVKRNITIGSFIIENDLKIDMCELGDDFIIKRGQLHGSLLINNLHAGSLTVAEILINKDLSVTFTEVKGDISFESFEMLGGIEDQAVNFVKAGRIIFRKATCWGELNLYNLDTLTLGVISSTFKNDLNFYTSRVDDRVIIQDNLFIDSLRLDQLAAGDASVSKNKILNCLWLEKNELDDLVVEDIDIRQVEIISGVYGSVTITQKTEPQGSIVFLTLKDIVSQKSVLIRDQLITGAAELSGNKFDFNLAIQGCKFESTLYLDNNHLSGKLELGGTEESNGYNGVYFKSAVSMSNNRVGSAIFVQTTFISSSCLVGNYFEGNLVIYDGYFSEVLDFSENYVGGTLTFNKTILKNVLILDHSFLDKRMSFVNTNILEYSFFDATLNGFSIPENWKMIGGRLRHPGKVYKEIPMEAYQPETREQGQQTVTGSNGETADRKTRRQLVKYILADENLKDESPIEKATIPYNMIRKHVLENMNYLNTAKDRWSDLQCLVFIYEENLEMIKTSFEVGEKIVSVRDKIEQILKRDYLTVYYDFIPEETIEDLKRTASYFYPADRTFEDEKVNELYNKLRDFFVGFAFCLEHFHRKTIFFDFVDTKEAAGQLKVDLYERLQDQYLTVKNIFGNSGELGNEDKAYYQWMHNRNLSDLYAAGKKKPLYWFKAAVFEKVFGWGVNLWRILGSTLITMLLFSFVYQFIFWANPDLFIKYDEVMVPASDISYPRTLFLSIQTTFSAFLGDWAPIGSGPVKALMTINSILGILFVTFLVAAFGRKMLR